MRFMLLMLPAGYAHASADARPSIEAIEKMRRFNKALQEAGVLLTLDGLHPPAAGVRVTTTEGKMRTVDGPFAESKQMIGGYWMIDVSSCDEAIAWASRCPLNDGDTIEIRQVFETGDFPPETQKAIERFEGAE